MIFTDNFAAPVPLGSFPSAVASKWTAYSGFPDTSGHGVYDPAKVVSIANGVMTLHLHTENGTHYVSLRSLSFPVTAPTRGRSMAGTRYGSRLTRYLDTRRPGCSGPTMTTGPKAKLTSPRAI